VDVRAARAAVHAYLERDVEDMAGDVYGFVVLARAVRCGTRLGREPRRWDDDVPLLLNASKPTEVQLLVHESNASALAFDACTLLVETLLGRGEALPEPLRRFVVEGLRGERRRPRRRGGSRYRNLARDHIVRRALLVAKKYRLSPTRSESKTNEIAGCDVVAECLAEFGIRLSAPAVAKVWENRAFE
jgi:hypothetical protein